ncbi:MAG: hypothetical protein L3J59_13475 [Methylococcaceae bacterium]|nr:hypothetical protein [Methylococcaceae bacterium]
MTLIKEGLGSLLSLALLAGCENYSGANQPTNCDSQFVVSDNRQIYLYEYRDSKSLDFDLLHKFENISNNGAFFDCARNTIVSPYGYKGEGRNESGVSIFKLDTKEVRDYNIPDGVNGQLGLYKNGVLLSSRLIYSSKVDKNLGFVPKSEIISKKYVNDNPDTVTKEIINDYKNGVLWKRYEYMHLFDLNKNKIIKSYKQNADFGRVIDGKLHAQFIDAFGIVNLENGYRKKIIERLSIKDNEKGLRLSVPANIISVFSDTGYYAITTDKSWNYSESREHKILKNIDANSIYMAIDGVLVKQISLPFKKPSYAITIGSEILVFDRGGNHVSKYNSLTKELLNYDISELLKLKNYSINSVGYTNNKFIFSMTNKKNTNGIIFSTNNEFSKASPIYKVNMSNMSVTTNNNIQTSFYRAVR